jgi:general secretion pathway protein N
LLVQALALLAPAAAQETQESALTPPPPVETAAPAAAAAPAAPASISPGFSLPRLDELAATRERPLFSPSRRPPPPPPPEPEVAVTEQPAPEPEPEPEKPPPFELAGIISGQALELVVLRNRDTDAVERVKRGAVVEGWEVVDVGPRFVVLERDGRSVRLALFEHPKTPPASEANQKPRRQSQSDDEEDDE